MFLLRHVEYMEMPYAVLAKPNGGRSEKNMRLFEKRSASFMDMYALQKYNFAQHVYDVTAHHQIDTQL